ncbi:hypothetical protein HJG60_010081 [Phyllostomus discolor]|uniref:Uncharacterized protein n=1 Tax=Phyllostomus discolor TaxID=89673 RepID=A0A834AXL3_9CHIR|nr:hypothetical protein HJG60_010081 [Phyllostomus discolor]
MLLPRRHPTGVSLPTSKVKCSGSVLGSGTRVSCANITRGPPLDLPGRRRWMEGKQRHTGVTATDSKLAFGSASEGCVHEVTGLKPARVVGRDGATGEAVSACPSSSAGFLTPFVRLLRPDLVFCFLQGVNDPRDERREPSSSVRSRSGLGCAHWAPRCSRGLIRPLGGQWWARPVDSGALCHSPDPSGVVSPISYTFKQVDV